MSRFGYMTFFDRTRHVPGAAARTISALLFLAACGGGSSDTTAPSTLGISPTSASISVDESNQFSALNAQGAVTWTSSNESVATVVGTGFTTAHAPGTATITAKDSRGTATATITVKSQAALLLSASSLTFAQQSGSADAATQTVSISDGGDNKVGTVSIASVTGAGGQATPWLTATLVGQTAPTSLTVHTSAGALAPGVYSATISVTAVGAKNGAQSVVVTFTVSAAPALQLSQSALTFTQVRNASAVAAQTVTASNSGGGTLTGIAATIAYQAGQASGWLSVTLDRNFAPAVLTVLPALGSLANGTYNATITVSAAGASNAPQTIAVTFVVAAQPAINLSSSALTFTFVRGGSATPQIVVVNNSGGGTLTGLSAAIRYTQPQSTGWLTATLDGGNAPANLTVTPAIGALADGTYNATIDITSANGSNNPQSIAVTFSVSSTGTIALSTPTLAFAAAPGAASPAAQIVNITNGAGSGVLGGIAIAVTYTAGQTGGWLTTSLNSTNSPAQISAQAVTGALVAGTYTANIRVTSTTASNSPRDIAVTFVVSATPAIALTTTALTFNATRGTEAAAQVVGVSNGGGGNLTGLTTSVSYQAGQPTGWLTATLTAGAPPANINVQPLIGALPNGTYNATISVASAVASNSPRTVAVTFTIVAGPSIGVTSTTVSFAATSGGASPAAQAQNVTNTGAGTLTGLTASVAYVSGTPGWLTATLNTPTATSTLTLTATTGALAAGTYTATVNIAATGAANSPVPITVSFVVAAPPTLVLGSNSVNSSGTHTATPATPVLISTPIAVTRLGGGALTNLGATVSAGAASWLSVSFNTNVTPATLTIKANVNALAPSATPYTGTVTVTSPDAVNSPQTISVSFTSLYSLALDVYPAIKSQCSGCHAGGTAPNLADSVSFYLGMVGVHTNGNPATYPLLNSKPFRIVPGNASLSYVIDEIQHAMNSDFMPPIGNTQVSTPTLNMFIAWINQGALRN